MTNNEMALMANIAINMQKNEVNEVLNKIRAEIEAKIVMRPWFDFDDRESDRNDAFLEVLDIIDKYKAESEDERIDKI